MITKSPCPECPEFEKCPTVRMLMMMQTAGLLDKVSKIHCPKAEQEVEGK
jgi:hypothetical protein